jgi:type I restriction enzyme S subunit
MLARTRLPKSWARSRIGDVVEDRIEQGLPEDAQEFTYVDISAVNNQRKEIIEARRIPISKAPSRARQRIQRGDVLVSTTRPNLNAVALVPPDLDGAIASTGFAVLRPVLLDSRWLFSVVQSEDFVTDMSALVKGALYPAIRPGDVHDYVMPVPPLAEQKRITAKLGKLLKRARNTQGALEPLPSLIQQFRAAVLEAACTGRLVPTEAELARKQHRDFESASVLLERLLHKRRAKWEADQLTKMRAAGKIPKDDRWKNKYPEPPTPSIAGLPRLPVGWVWATMPQLGELNRGKSLHRPRDDPKLYGGSYPFIQTGDVARGKGRIRQYTQTYSEFGLAQSRLWPAGTMCITIAATIAETGILEFDACFPDSIVGFIPQDKSVKTEFVESFFRTIKEDIQRYAPGVAQKNINLEVLEKIAIPVPPSSEQKRIVAEVERRLSALHHVEKQVSVALEQVSQFRVSLLDRALSGKLVKQNKTDEPATQLLGRIRARREIQLQTQKRKKPDRKAKMKKLSRDVVKETIGKLPKNRFSFAELSATLPADYDLLKDIVFELLDEKKPSLKQVFATKAKEMQFQKVKP